MSESLRWGILATGGIAHLFTNDLKRQRLRRAGRRLAIAGERRRVRGRVRHPERARQLRGARRRPRGRRDLRRHAASDHAARATLALEAGKHVLVEKPFTLNAGQARPVADLAAAAGCWRSRRCGRGTCRTWSASARSSRRHPRRAAHAHRRPHAEALRRPGAPHQRARARRRRAARPRHLPGLVRVGPLRRARAPSRPRRRSRRPAPTRRSR